MRQHHVIEAVGIVENGYRRGLGIANGALVKPGGGQKRPEEPVWLWDRARCRAVPRDRREPGCDGRSPIPPRGS